LVLTVGAVGDTVFEMDTLATGVTVMEAEAEVESWPFGRGLLADWVSVAVLTTGLPPFEPLTVARMTIEAESPTTRVPMFHVRVLPEAEADVVAPSAVVGATAGATSVAASPDAVPVAAAVSVADAPPPATAEMVVPVVMLAPIM
jgi:hypothetical protein